MKCDPFGCQSLWVEADVSSARLFGGVADSDMDSISPPTALAVPSPLRRLRIQVNAAIATTIPSPVMVIGHCGRNTIEPLIPRAIRRTQLRRAHTNWR